MIARRWVTIFAGTMATNAVAETPQPQFPQEPTMDNDLVGRLRDGLFWSDGADLTYALMNEAADAIREAERLEALASRYDETLIALDSAR